MNENFIWIMNIMTKYFKNLLNFCNKISEGSEFLMS